MSTFLFIAALVVLVIGCFPFWQIWRFLHSKKISEDEPLGEDGVNYICRRLTIIHICAITEAARLIAQAILCFIHSI